MDILELMKERHRGDMRLNNAVERDRAACF